MYNKHKVFLVLIIVVYRTAFSYLGRGAIETTAPGDKMV